MGEEGADLFRFILLNGGETLIRDFTPGQDTIALRAFNIASFDALMENIEVDSHGNTIIHHDVPSGFVTETITLYGITPDQLQESDFIFS